VLLTARISDTIVPVRLGRSFRWLLASSIATNVGDGIALAAGPLLIASQTLDPLLVSMALLSQQLPNLLFGIPAAVALVTMVVFGAHALVWGTTSTVVRQRAVPDKLLGRVTGVYTVGLIGGLVVGAPIGGLLARALGITAPFWFGFIGSALLVVILWRQFDNIAHEGAA
jgi:hypothetical protein